MPNEYTENGVRYSSEKCGSPRNRVDSVTNLDIDEAITRRFGLEAEDIPVVELSQWEYGGENVTALTGDVTKRRTVATFHSPPSGRVAVRGNFLEGNLLLILERNAMLKLVGTYLGFLVLPLFLIIGIDNFTPQYIPLTFDTYGGALCILLVIRWAVRINL